MRLQEIARDCSLCFLLVALLFCARVIKQFHMKDWKSCYTQFAFPTLHITNAIEQRAHFFWHFERLKRLHQHSALHYNVHDWLRDASIWISLAHFFLLSFDVNFYRILILVFQGSCQNTLGKHSSATERQWSADGKNGDFNFQSYLKWRDDCNLQSARATRVEAWTHLS